MTEVGFCDRLAGYAATATIAQLDQKTCDHLGDALTNWVACAAGGARHMTVDAAARGLVALGGPAQFDFMPIGRSDQVNLIDVAVLDCLSSAVLAYDDIHFETALHPTGPVAAALLALARRDKLSGREFLTALHIGMEVQCRVALAYTAPTAGAKLGWYATGIAGGIGVAAAIGRVIGLDASEIANAMGLAASRANGNRGTHGSMAAAYVPSTAAESGIVAAFLTQGGVTCGTRALDGTNGLIELLADRPDYAFALDGLGSSSLAAQTAFKPYPSGFVTHAAIDAGLELYARDAFALSGVKSIELRVSPASYALGNNPEPIDAVEAQVSIAHWAALALVHGAAGIEQADARWLRDPDVVSVRERIEIVPDPALSNPQCLACVLQNDGSAEHVFIEHATGSPGRPMTRRDVARKTSALFRSAMDEERALRLQAFCSDVLSAGNVAALLLI